LKANLVHLLLVYFACYVTAFLTTVLCCVDGCLFLLDFVTLCLGISENLLTYCCEFLQFWQCFGCVG